MSGIVVQVLHRTAVNVQKMFHFCRDGIQTKKLDIQEISSLFQWQRVQKALNLHIPDDLRVNIHNVILLVWFGKQNASVE